MKNFCCAITGANGYLGSVFCNALHNREIEVIQLTRDSPEAFNLKDGIEPDYFRLKKINCLIHCAWDFNVTEDEYENINSGGAIKLFKAAKEAGVEKMIFISSMSAFYNCKSRYGITKLKTEVELLPLGVIVVRPGLVYGDKPKGMLGVFVRLVRRSPIIPIVGDGRYVQHTCHEEDLGNLITELITLPVSSKTPPIVAANSIGISLKEILDNVSAKVGKKPLYIYIPWKIVWVGLLIAEKMKINLPLKSDSVIGLVFPDINPNFDMLRPYKSKFRAFNN